MKLLKVLAAVVLLSAAGAAAQDVRSEKYPRQGGETAAPRRKPEPKTWEATADLAAVSDANISHLLVNSPVKSNKKVKDNIRHLSAGFTADPAFASKAGLELSYSYDDYAYRTHKPFSYHDHSFSVGLTPDLGKGWSLDLGWDLDLIGDKTGTIAEDGSVNGGLIWRGPGGLRLKGGYERGRDNVRTNPKKDADTGALYLSASRRFLKKHLAFLSLRAKTNAADGPDYAYKSRSAVLGLISKWSSRFKLVTSASSVQKDYDNIDSRFLKRRSDATYSFRIKPVFTLFKGVYAEGSFTYLDNASNVAIKRYTDRIYSVGLAGRF
ncbi:MAG: hypothetical protein M0025_09610 [Elusimicrobia bacterium]|nr:hypothetical protein [Elusimicrobiota bacterium]